MSRILQRLWDGEIEEEDDRLVPKICFEPFVYQKQTPNQQEMVNWGHEARIAQLVKEYFTPGGHGYKPQDFERWYWMSGETISGTSDVRWLSERRWNDKGLKKWWCEVAPMTYMFAIVWPTNLGQAWAKFQIVYR